jgi:hypothetical protein
MFVHVPTVPASAHDLHVPVQAVAQQTPCAQKSDAQSLATAHVAPFAAFPQLVPVQTFGDAQSLGAAHEVLQTPATPAPHAYGAQDDDVTVWHVPVPLQVRAGVKVVPEQLAAAHCVPAAYRRHAPATLQNPSVPQLVAP